MCKRILSFILLILVLCLVAGCQTESAEPTSDRVDLYINVEGSLYRGNPNKLVSRVANPDGNYTVNFACNGEQQRLTVAPEALKKGLDMQDIVHLIFDENGVVIDFKTVEECTGGYIVKNDFVEEVDGSSILCNTSPNFDGYQKNVITTDATGIYRIGGTDVLVGTVTTVQPEDKITAVCDKNGNVTHVFVEPLRPIPDIYWNIQRKYNSTLKSTTRETNAVGVYEFQFAVGGQVVTLRAKDRDTATKIDAIAAKCMALTFDEEGYISTVTSAYNACGGSFGSWYHVTELIGNTIYAHKYSAGSDQGNSGNAIMAKNFVAYNVSNSGVMGEQTELRVGDQVHCLVNTRGQVVIAFVISRLVDTDVYWNVERHYDSNIKQTTRRPDSDGWYHILLAVNGEQVTLKTKDKDIVNSIDGRNDRHFALETDGDVITAFHKPSAPSGGNYFASWCYVQSIDENGVVTAAKNSEAAPEMAKMAENCQVYNVGSMYSSHVGEKTTLRVGDQIHGERNLNGELVLIYVVGGRLANSPMYWNIDRKWDSQKKATARQPDAEGYYTLTLAVKGEQTTVRTKDIELVNAMDKSAAAAFGLSLNGDIVTKIYTPKQVAGGSGWSSWCDVMEIREYGTVVTQRIISGDNQGKTYTARMDWNCKVYDVSPYYSSHKGEKATLQVGDRIQGYLNKDGEIEYIYIITRNLTANNPDHFHCVCAGNREHSCEDTGFTAWSNKRIMPTNGAWYLTEDVTMEEAVTIPAGSSLQLCLNGHTINGQSTGTLSMFRVNGELIITDCQQEQGSLIANTVAYGSVIYQFDAQQTNVELYAGNLKSNVASQTRGGGIIYVGDKGTDKATFNMYGGTVTGLTVDGARGGAVNIAVGQTFNMYGGTIQGGTATGGGNITLTRGTLNIYGGTITGGTSTQIQGGGIYVGNGTLNVSGKVLVNGNSGGNIFLSAGGKLVTGDLEDTSVLGISMASAGVFTTVSDLADAECFFSDLPDYILHNDNGKLSLLTGHTHCVCGDGSHDGTGSHSCDATTVWDAWKDPNALPTKGNWYLTTDVTIPGAVNIAENTTLRLCLNGYTVKGHSSGTLSMFRVKGDFVLTDCAAEEKWGSVIANTMAYGDVIYQFDSVKTTVDLFAGHLSTSLTSQTRNGGIVYIGDKGTVKSTFNMYGGTITGVTVTSGRGGTVKLTQGHTFNMYGGRISGGSAPSGGNIDLASGTMNLFGGIITGGSATDKGGNIYVNSGTLTIDGCTIEEGTATNYGGNIDFVKGTLIFKSGTVKNGSAKNAGGIRIQKDGIFKMYDGAILSGSYATVESGNLQINTGATFDMYGGQITEGGKKDGIAVTTYGGNVNVYGTMNMYGGSITNGAATKRGGNIAGYGSFTLNITTHTSSTTTPSIRGGDVALRGTAPKLNMTCGSIMAGQVYVQAGTVHVEATAVIEELYLAGGSLTAGVLSNTAYVGIAMETPGVFLNNVTEAVASRFESTDDSYQITLNDTSLALVRKE